MPRHDRPAPPDTADVAWPVATERPKFLAQRPRRRTGPRRLGSSKTGWTVTRQ